MVVSNKQQSEGGQWQNLYPRREIMVLGMGLKGEELMNKGCCARLEYAVSNKVYDLKATISIIR